MFASGDPITQAAIQNESAETITVTLDDGEGTITFADIPPATSSEYQDVEFEVLEGVILLVDAGLAMEGEVDLSSGYQNLITLFADAPPTVDAVAEGPDPEGSGTEACGNGW